MEREKRVGFSLGVRTWGREGEEEDLEGVIPQGPSGKSIGFWFPPQRKLNSAMSEKLFCKIISSDYSNSACSSLLLTTFV